jgi:hypothetical protein
VDPPQVWTADRRRIVYLHLSREGRSVVGLFAFVSAPV